MIGKTLGHYEITGKLGQGGMGEVFRARDIKLDREVALKMLPDEVATDPERLARLRREAKVLASLNHSNIAAIYDIEETPEAIFLVMELVEGEDLSVRIANKSLLMHESLEIARQIAEGLQEAHSKGVVHRDLKPANVKVSADDKATILDFGLARAFSDDADSDADPALSPTITALHTRAGTILGTAAYMSPEQARGLPVDKRTDIWAFGVMLFEMLSGDPLFDGPTVSDKLAAILTADPDWEKLPPETPPRIRELLERCLARHRQDRLQDIGDARMDIAWTQQGRTGEVRTLGGKPAPTRRMPVLAGALAFAALVGVVSWNLAARSGQPSAGATASAQVRRLSMEFGSQLRFGNDIVAPDGSIGLFARYKDAQAAGTNLWRLFYRAPDDGELREIEGSVGATAFCFSPDSRWIAMLAPDQTAVSSYFLWKIPVDGSSPPLRLRPWPREWAFEIHWMRAGYLVTTTHDGRFVKISADGEVSGVPVEIRKAGFDDPFGVDGSPGAELDDGIHLLDNVEIWADEGYSRSIAIANLETGEARVIIRNGSSPHWLPSGHILFSRGTTILAVKVDPRTLEATGAPVAVEVGLRTTASWTHGSFGLSHDGTLSYVPGGLVGQQQRLMWTDARFAEFRPWSDERRNFDGFPILSPDGKFVTIWIAASNGIFETWISDVDRPGWRRFAYEKNVDCMPAAWTPDSKQLVCVLSTSAGQKLVQYPVDQAGQKTLLFESAGEYMQYRGFCFADGGETLILDQRTGGHDSLVMLELAKDRSGEVVVRDLVTDASEAALSPDGRWISYRSEAAGRTQLILRRWRGGGQMGPEIHVVSHSDLGESDWHRPDAASPMEIWYFRDRKLYAVTVTTEPELTLGEPRFLMENPERLAGFDMAPDGRILARFRGEDEADPEHITVVLNWLSSIQSQLPR